LQTVLFQIIFCRTIRNPWRHKSKQAVTS